MRLSAGAGVLAAALASPVIVPGTPAFAAPSVDDGWHSAVTRAIPSNNTDDDTTTASAAIRNRHVTALRALPWAPRRHTDLRIEVLCPYPSNHATVASDAIDPSGSRRGSRELGLSLDDDGYGHDTETVPFDARLGVRDIWLRCVRVETHPVTLVRKVTLISRLHATIRVRKHVLWKFCDAYGFSCKKRGDHWYVSRDDNPRKWRHPDADNPRKWRHPHPPKPAKAAKAAKRKWRHAEPITDAKATKRKWRHADLLDRGKKARRHAY